MNFNDIETKGAIERVIEFSDGKKICDYRNNTVLATGRAALAACLTNEIGDGFNFYISKMLFGDGGTTGGIPNYVTAQRTGLFGITRVSKPVISRRNANTQYQALFTSVITFQEGNGFTLNEMALQMANGDLYSLATFPDLSKTAEMQITWNWRLSFV